MENRTTITQEINATFPDNNQKFITAEKVRVFMDIINESKFNLVDDDLSNISLNSSEFNSTNALDALLELRQIITPIFYIQIEWSFEKDGAGAGTQDSWEYDIIDGDFTGGNGTGSGAIIDANILFSDIVVQTGYPIRFENFMEVGSLTNTGFKIIHPTDYYNPQISGVQSTILNYYIYLDA